MMSSLLILVKTTENTIGHSKPPYKFTYTRRSHDRVQPPLNISLEGSWTYNELNSQLKIRHLTHEKSNDLTNLYSKLTEN